MYKLTKRQKEVLRLVCYDNKTIADKLGIKETSVKTHSQYIKNRLNADNKAKCIIVALKHQLLSLEEIETEL